MKRRNSSENILDVEENALGEPKVINRTKRDAGETVLYPICEEDGLRQTWSMQLLSLIFEIFRFTF